MAWGRPTTYEDRFVDLAEEYLAKSVDAYEVMLDQEIITTKEEEVWWVAGTKKTEMKTTKIWRLNVDLPTIEWLSQHLNVSRSNIYKWKWEHEEFSDILDKILEEQAKRLVNSWLSGRYNPTIAKMILSGHWYVEKQAVEHTGSMVVESKEIDNKKLEDIHQFIQDRLK